MNSCISISFTRVLCHVQPRELGQVSDVFARMLNLESINSQLPVIYSTSLDPTPEDSLSYMLFGSQEH